jgi:hypothetical protein
VTRGRAGAYSLGWGATCEALGEPEVTPVVFAEGLKQNEEQADGFEEVRLADVGVAMKNVDRAELIEA